jgi:hypothetical protein
MPFKNDDQRKAAFARMKGGRGGGTRRRYTAPQRSLWDILGIADPSSPRYADRVARGPGIDYTQGTFTGTGGARYNTPGSNWFISGENQPNYPGSPGGTGLYQGFMENEFTPASTLLSALYDLAIRGVDPDTGQMIAPYGTPGTLKFGAGTPWMDPHAEQAAAGRIPFDPLVFGSSPSNPYPTLSGQYWHRPTLGPRPRWLQWYERINE